MVVHALSGCVAGVVSSLVTNPLDVVKTRLQTQDASAFHPRTTGFLGTLRSLVATEGSRALFRGL